MDDGKVIDMFTREEIPAASQSEFVAEFAANHDLGDLVNAVAGMQEAESEEVFREFLAEVRQIVGTFPT